MSEDRKRLLNDLRVIDLRVELEKRNLDKSGVRNVLFQRLFEYLEKEGHDPNTFEFDAPPKKTPNKRTRRSESVVEAEEPEETPAMEDMIVQDDVGEDDETEQPETKPEVESNESQKQEKMDVETSNELKTTRKRESNDEPEVSDAKKPCLEKEITPEEDQNKAPENNTDAEDSINLDLGDDELLNEESDSTTKAKKDEAAEQKSQEESSAAPPVAEAAPAPAPATPADANTDATDTDTPAQTNADAPTPSDDTIDKKDQDQKEDEKETEDESSDKKDKKEDSKEGGARNLWVSGLSGDTRAKDLKQLCSKHGKVIGAKVVTNARTPGSRCYGYVTMASAQDADNCIKNLHRTELHGRLISVEKAKSESESSTRRQPSARPDRRSSGDRVKDEQENKESTGNNSESKDKKKDEEASGADSVRSTSRTRAKSHRSDKVRRTRSRERKRSPREKERDMMRAWERSRAAREEDRRRRAAEEALRERERRQRQEKQRLALEREKLRAERERIEREKNELLRLERERHRLEREKLELERLELKRAQLRLEEERRKRGYEASAAYRKSAPSPPPAPSYERERHKRPPPPPMTSSRGQFEAPPPPRFELGAAYERGDKRDRDRGDYKRDYPRHVSTSNIKYQSNGSAGDDARQPPPISRPKEPSRAYESRSYRSPPGGKPEPRWAASTRYADAPPPAKGSSGAEGWAASGGGGGGGETRYAGGASGGAYEARYPPAYQAPPPGAYADRYAAAPRDYRPKY